MSAPEWLDRIICLLYPPRCATCDEVVAYDELWCAGCKPQRADDFDVSSGDAPLLCAVLSPFFYEGSTRDAVLHLKRRPDIRAAHGLAAEMADLICAQWDALPFDLLVPVPASAARNFNHAGLLAAALAKQLKLPVAHGVLARRDDMPAQHGLSAQERKRNAAAAFFPGETAGVSGKRVLLVDDVKTTGATLLACAKLLRQAGAAQVFGATVCKTTDFSDKSEKNT